MTTYSFINSVPGDFTATAGVSSSASGTDIPNLESVTSNVAMISTQDFQVDFDLSLPSAGHNTWDIGWVYVLFGSSTAAGWVEVSLRMNVSGSDNQFYLNSVAGNNLEGTFSRTAAQDAAFTLTIGYDSGANELYVQEGGVDKYRAAPSQTIPDPVIRDGVKVGSTSSTASILLTSIDTGGGAALPVAGFTVAPTSGTSPLMVSITDTSTNAVNYTYDWGDGTPLSTSANPTHSYTAGGNFTITQTVDDGIGNSDQTTQVVNVTQGLTCLAQAIVRADLSPGVVLSGSETLTWSIVSGNGVITAGQGTLEVTVDSTGSALSENILLQIDASGGVFATPEQHQAGITITRTPPPASNFPPVADPGGPYNATTGVSMNLDGSASSDPDSDPLTYDWDTSDGQPNLTGVSPSKTWTPAGNYTIGLTVNDGTVDSSRMTTTVNVTDPGGPGPGPGGSATNLGQQFFDPDSSNASNISAGQQTTNLTALKAQTTDPSPQAIIDAYAGTPNNDVNYNLAYHHGKIAFDALP